MKIWLMLLWIGLVDSSGNLCIARGMRRMEKKILALGICFLTVSFFSFLTLLSWANLSFVLPASSLSYVANTMGAKIFLKERVSPERWMGVLLIGLGVALISLTPAGS